MRPKIFILSEKQRFYAFVRIRAWSMKPQMEREATMQTLNEAVAASNALTDRQTDTLTDTARTDTDRHTERTAQSTAQSTEAAERTRGIGMEPRESEPRGFTHRKL